MEENLNGGDEKVYTGDFRKDFVKSAVSRRLHM